MLDLFTPEPPVITYALRDYQAAVVDAAYNFCAYRNGHGYIKAPGGSGKSVMIAKLAERLYDDGHKIVIMARNEKLLRQNKAKFAAKYQDDIGIYCAGIGEKDLSKRITIASAQSIAGQRMDGIGFVLIDECHELPEEQRGQYWQFMQANGIPRIVGFTATPFRTATGAIKWGEEIIAIPIKPLIEAGHLVPPYNKIGVELDLSHIEINAGEYNQEQIAAVYDDSALFELTMQKLLHYSANRHHVLVFGQSLRHCDALAMALETEGKSVTTVSKDTDKDELTHHIIPAFERGEYQYLINCQLLTTGIDIPCIDMIALLMSTASKIKFEQATYRGTRPYPNKHNFLLLDMGNNLMTHGALGSPLREKSKRPKSEPKEKTAADDKICPVCCSFVEAGDKQCQECGHVWPDAPRKANHSDKHDAKSAAYYGESGESMTERIKVYDVMYEKKRSKSGNDMITVKYMSLAAKYGSVNEYLLPHHASEFVRSRVLKFFKRNGRDGYELAAGANCDLSVYSLDDLIHLATANCRTPSEILVDFGKEFPEIIRIDFEPSVEAYNFAEMLDDEIPF